MNQEAYGKKFYQTYGNFAGDTLSPEIVRLSQPYIKGKVLDVGAGSGAMMEQIQKHQTDEIYGIDIAPKENYIIEAGIDNIPFDNEYFDCVTCTATLEHLNSATLKNGLKEVYRILKPNGFFIITVPYKEDMKQNIIECPDCGIKFHRWGHIQTFDEAELYHLLGNSDLEIINFRVIPLGFMATHKYLKYLIPYINNFPFVRYEERTIFAVAQKVKC